MLFDGEHGQVWTIPLNCSKHSARVQTASSYLVNIIGLKAKCTFPVNKAPQPLARVETVVLARFDCASNPRNRTRFLGLAII